MNEKDLMDLGPVLSTQTWTIEFGSDGTAALIVQMPWDLAKSLIEKVGAEIKEKSQTEQ